MERCVNDPILVDNALNDSMLNPRLLKKTGDDDEKKHGENEPNNSTVQNNRVEDEVRRNDNTVGDTTTKMNELVEVSNDESNADDEVDDSTNVRRLSRPCKQRVDINVEDIGDCDDKDDPDFKHK